MSTFLGLRLTMPFFVVSESDEAAADSLSLKRYTTSRGAQRWRWRFSLEPTRAGQDIAAIMSHRAQNGLSGRFDFDVPQVVDAGSPPAATVAGVAGAAAVTATIAAGDRLLLPLGLFVAFGTARKIYQLTADIDSNAATQPDVTVTLGTTTAKSGAPASPAMVGVPPGADAAITFALIAAGYYYAIELPAGYTLESWTSGGTDVDFDHGTGADSQRWYSRDAAAAAATDVAFTIRVQSDTEEVSLPIFPALTVAASGALDVSPTALAMYADDGREGVTMDRGRIVRAVVELVEAL